MAPHADADSQAPPQYALMPIQIAKGPVSQRIRAPSAMTYLGNKDYLR